MATHEKQKGISIPEAVQPRYAAVVTLTDAFSESNLDDEYRDLCRKLALKLARKRPSPLLRGKVEVWACGITYFIGSVNFLFDKSQVPHLSAAELCERYGVSQSAASAKATELRRLTKAMPLDPEWCRPSRLDENPLAWMISLNGMAVDVRMMPREVQEIALQKGLIPYLPAPEASQ